MQSHAQCKPVALASLGVPHTRVEVWPGDMLLPPGGALLVAVVDVQ